MQYRDQYGNAVGHTEVIEISIDDTIAAINRKRDLDNFRKFCAESSTINDITYDGIKVHTWWGFHR